MKSTLIFIAFVLAVLGFLFAISGKKYPQMPADANHIGVTETALCISCHGLGKQYAQKSTHPPKFECFKCHKQKRAKNP
jgi:hypothetical protein